MRIIGMDIHRVAAEVVALCEGELTKLKRVPMLRDQLAAFAQKELTHDDHVIIEATGNAAAVAELLEPFVARVVIANPKQVRMIAHAKIGLNPSVRQSGEGPAYHGRITKQGRGQARGMLVEAAWAAARSPGPLRAFYQRIAARRGKHIAAVATARKLAMILWHMLTKQTDYIWARPALLARKFRTIELKAGRPAEHAKRGAAYDYNIPEKRVAERERSEQAERDYARFTSNWRSRPKRRAKTA